MKRIKEIISLLLEYMLYAVGFIVIGYLLCSIYDNVDTTNILKIVTFLWLFS